MMVIYEGDYYIELNPRLLRWELYCWESKGARLVTWWSYKSPFTFKEAKRIIERLKNSIESEKYRKEWEYDNEISS